MGASLQPAGSVSQRHACYLLELLAELACDDDLALGPEALLQVLQRGRNAMRRFVEHHRPGQLERFARLAACGRLPGQKTGEEEAAGDQAQGRDPPAVPPAPR